MNTNTYILKAAATKIPDPVVAKKLGISVEELIKQRALIISELSSRTGENGYSDLIDCFSILCHQYQLVGESLKAVASALGEIATGEEIAKEVPLCEEEDRRAVTDSLRKKFIILRRFDLTPFRENLLIDPPKN